MQTLKSMQKQRQLGWLLMVAALASSSLLVPAAVTEMPPNVSNSHLGSGNNVKLDLRFSVLFRTGFRVEHDLPWQLTKKDNTETWRNLPPEISSHIFDEDDIAHNSFWRTMGDSHGEGKVEYTFSDRYQKRTHYLTLTINDINVGASPTEKNILDKTNCSIQDYKKNPDSSFKCSVSAFPHQDGNEIDWQITFLVS